MDTWVTTAFFAVYEYSSIPRIHKHTYQWYLMTFRVLRLKQIDIQNE